MKVGGAGSVVLVLVGRGVQAKLVVRMLQAAILFMLTL